MHDEMEEPPPWLRLYRRGSARFQQLEPHYRGTLIEVLRYTDSSGRINLDGRSPEEALLRLLGNTRSFRPVLKAALAEGFRIEMCSIVDGYLVFKSWFKYQPRGRRSAQSKSSAEASQEQSNGVATASQEHRNDIALVSKSAKSLDQGPQRREEKRREEEKETLRSMPDLALLPFEPSDQPPDPVVEVFAHWRHVMGHDKARLDDKRRRRIKAALKHGYSTAELCAAVDGCKSSAWHMGANDRSTRYDGIDVVFRDADQIDRFAQLASQTQPAAGATPARPQSPPPDAIQAARERLRHQAERIERERAENERIARARVERERGLA
jgi:hypothetical protein